MCCIISDALLTLIENLVLYHLRMLYSSIFSVPFKTSLARFRTTSFTVTRTSQRTVEHHSIVGPPMFERNRCCIASLFLIPKHDLITGTAAIYFGIVNMIISVIYFAFHVSAGTRFYHRYGRDSIRNALRSLRCSAVFLTFRTVSFMQRHVGFPLDCITYDVMRPIRCSPFNVVGLTESPVRPRFHGRNGSTDLTFGKNSSHATT